MKQQSSGLGVEIAAPEWAHGCDQCKFGYVNAPDLTGVDSLAMERLAHAELYMVQFCSCKAGVMQERYLKRLKQKLADEAARTPMMSMSVIQRGSHPDIDAAMNAVVAAMPMPTFNGQGVDYAPA